MAGVLIGCTLLLDARREGEEREIPPRLVALWAAGGALLFLAAAVTFPFLIPLLYGPALQAAVLSAEILLVGTLMLSQRTVLTGVALGLGAPLLGSRAEARPPSLRRRRSRAEA